MDTQDSTTKTCSKCGREHPATTAHFYRNGRGAFGLQSVCKSCANDRNKQWHKDNPEQSRALYQRKQARKMERDPIGTKSSAAVRSKRHYEANRDTKREQSRESMAKWRALHRDIHRLREHQRRQNLRDKPFDFTVDDWNETQAWFEHKCVYCGRAADMWTVLAPDHVIPIVSPDCPGTIPSNIVPACHARKGSPAGLVGCNQSKGARDLNSWLVSRFGPAKARKITRRITEFQEGRRR